MKHTLYNSKKEVLQLKNATNQILLKRGLQLDAEDLTTLLETQKRACAKYDMMEFDTHPIHQLASLFMYSPYITQDRFCSVICDALYTYYAIQQKNTNSCYDDEVVDALYQTYLQHKGVFTSTMLLQVLHKLAVIK